VGEQRRNAKTKRRGGERWQQRRPAAPAFANAAARRRRKSGRGEALASVHCHGARWTGLAYSTGTLRVWLPEGV